MPRNLRLPFAAIALFLLALPAALGKPGLPFGLRADEGSWLAMAGSLAFDRDLDCEQPDLDRLFAEFPFGGRIRLQLAEGAASAPRYGLPLPYPLLAAPFVALLGANGLLVLNMALLLTAIALVGWRLGRFLEPALAAIFAFGFFLWSPAFAYALWHRPGLLLAALGSAAAVFGWPDDERPPIAWRLALGAAALALACLHQPSLALLALPIALAWFSRRDDPAAGQALRVWSLSFVALLAAGALVQEALLGDPFGHAVDRYTVQQPADHPWQQERVVADPPTRPFTPARLALALVDQRRGFLPYCPLALAALLLCRLPRRRLALAACLLALVLAQPWLGDYDPELPANPAWLGFLPFFALFVDRLPGRFLAGAYLVGILMAGPYLNALLGALDGNVHGHTRNVPYRFLPLDPEEAHELGGFLAVPVAGDLRLLLPSDVFNRVGDEVFLLGGERADFFLESPRTIEQGLFQIRSVAVPNRVLLTSAAQREDLHFQERPAVAHRLLALGPGVRRADGKSWLYPLHARAERGAKSFWYAATDDGTYVGVALAFLGTPAEVARDVYALEWRRCGAPAELRPGAQGLALVTVANTSAEPWPAKGASRVRLASRWLREDGAPVADNPDRTSLVGDLGPGGEATLWLALRAPREEGSYLLEFDAVRENVAWFGDKREIPRCRMPVAVRR